MQGWRQGGGNSTIDGGKIGKRVRKGGRIFGTVRRIEIIGKEDTENSKAQWQISTPLSQSPTSIRTASESLADIRILQTDDESEGEGEDESYADVLEEDENAAGTSAVDMMPILVWSLRQIKHYFEAPEEKIRKQGEREQEQAASMTMTTTNKWKKSSTDTTTTTNNNNTTSTTTADNNNTSRMTIISPTI